MVKGFIERIECRSGKESRVRRADNVFKECFHILIPTYNPAVGFCVDSDGLGSMMAARLSSATIERISYLNPYCI